MCHSVRLLPFILRGNILKKKNSTRKLNVNYVNRSTIVIQWPILMLSQSESGIQQHLKMKMQCLFICMVPIIITINWLINRTKINSWFEINTHLIFSLHFFLFLNRQPEKFLRFRNFRLAILVLRRNRFAKRKTKYEIRLKNRSTKSVYRNVKQIDRHRLCVCMVKANRKLTTKSDLSYWVRAAI